MAVPKKKTSKAKTRSRRASAWKLEAPARSLCPQCGRAMVRAGGACAAFSAGNTGAAMAAALLRLGRLGGVARPAIATPIPVPGATPTILVDAGANAECQAEWLVQFGQLGAAFSRVRYGIDN